MMWIYKIASAFLVLFSTQIVNTYLTAFLNRQPQAGRAKWGAWTLYLLMHFYMAATDALHPLFVLVLNIILVFFICQTSYTGTIKRKIFLSSILYSVWMLDEIAVNYILGFAGVTTYAYSFVTGTAISQMIMYTFVHALKRCKKSRMLEDISLKYWFQLLIVPIVTMYVMHNIYHYFTLLNRNDTFFLLTPVLMLLVNYIIFDVYDKLGNQLETEKKNLAYEQQITLCNKQAAERELAYEETRQLRHDLTDYLIDLETEIRSGNISNAEKKIEDLINRNKIYRQEISRSGNLVIDSLINYKYSIAQVQGIDMKCHVFVPEKLPFVGSDLCIILGNLIDNAQEAVACLPEEKRQIRIGVVLRRRTLNITIKNNYQENVRKDKTGQLITSKPDKKNHGIGLSSVQRAVEKYNGELITETENGCFQAMVLLYLPEK